MLGFLISLIILGYTFLIGLFQSFGWFLGKDDPFNFASGVNEAVVPLPIKYLGYTMNSVVTNRTYWLVVFIGCVLYSLEQLIVAMSVKPDLKFLNAVALKNKANTVEKFNDDDDDDDDDDDYDIDDQIEKFEEQTDAFSPF